MAKPNTKKMEETILSAFKVAKDATNSYLTAHPEDWFPCGFAWVVFDGRSPAVNVLKKMFPDENDNRRGRRGYPKGWHIWNPSDSSTQCMDAKMAGAQAFCTVLNQAGIDVYADCRMD